MFGASLSSSAHSQALSSAQELIEMLGGSLGGNYQWFLLVATLGAILGITQCIVRGLVNLGR